MSYVKDNIFRALAFVALGFVLGYVVAYVILQYQFEWFKYSSMARNVKLYEELTELLDADNHGVVRQRLIENLEKDTSTLSSCLTGFCADGRNEYYRQVYESSFNKINELKRSEQ